MTEKDENKIIVSEDLQETLTYDKLEMGSVEEIKKGDKLVGMVEKGDRLIMTIDHPLRVKKVTKKEIILERYEPLKDDPLKRHELAASITTKIESDLKSQIAAAVEKALEEKSIDELSETLELTIKGAKTEVKRRRGCMFVQIGEKSFKV